MYLANFPSQQLPTDFTEEANSSGGPISDFIVSPFSSFLHQSSPSTTDEIELLETLSDENGYFTFPSWGPKFNSNFDAMATGNPTLLIFKRGYLFKNLSNSDAGFSKCRRWSIVQRSDWDGKTIQLKNNEYEKIQASIDSQGLMSLAKSLVMLFGHDIGDRFQCHVMRGGFLN